MKTAHKIDCRFHGVQEASFVCEHLVHGEQLGFNYVDSEKAERPDAWCDTCDGTKARKKLVQFCGRCYDIAKQRNRK